MKAITIKSPWAQLIFADSPNRKDIENRDWPTRLRGQVAIHASKKIDPVEIASAAALIAERGIEIQMPSTDELQRTAGTIIGTVEILDCVEWSESSWFVGDYGFVLANPRLLPEPLPYRGSLGFWDAPLLMAEQTQ